MERKAIDIMAEDPKNVIAYEGKDKDGNLSIFCPYCYEEKTQEIFSIPIFRKDIFDAFGNHLIRCPICGVEINPTLGSKEDRNPRCEKCSEYTTHQYRWPDGRVTYYCESCGFDNDEEQK